MQTTISNIKINNDQIIITYDNKKEKTIIYNKENKQRLLDELIKNKDYLINQKKQLKKYIIILDLSTILSIFGTIFSYIISNNFLLNTFLSILCLDIIFINFLIFKVFKNDYLGIKDILTCIKKLKLPTEDKYILDKKIININDYRNNQQFFSELLIDNAYPNGKVLEFKRK